MTIRLWAACGGSLGILAAVAATPAAAATAKGDSAEVEALIVTAQKRAENVQTVPLAITAVSGATLERQHIDTVQQLRYVDPSVSYTQSTSPRSSGFRVRGVGTNSFSTGIEQSVSTVVDGVVLADPAAAQSLLDIDHVEILRGPQGMLFGKNASAGVVVINTRDPQLNSYEGYGRLAVGNREDRLLQAVVNAPIGDNAAFRVGASYRHLAPSLTNVITGKGVDVTDIRTIQGKLLWRPNDRLKAVLSATYSYAPNFCCAPTWRVVTPGYITAYGNNLYGIVAGPKNTRTATDYQPDGYSKSYGAALSLDYDLGDYTLTSITSWQESHGRAIFDGDQMAFNYLSYNGSNQSYRSNTQELRLASPTGGRFDYVAGLYYYQSWTNGTIFQSGYLQLLTPPATTPTPTTTLRSSARAQRVRSQSAAGFFQGNLHITDRFNVIAGFRYTKDDLDLLYDNHPFLPGTIAVTLPEITQLRQSVGNDNISWRIGPQFEVTPDIILYATAAAGYKGPGVSATTVTSLTQDQRVGPETSRSYEAGLRTTLMDRRLQLNATVFRVRYKGFQAQVLDTSSPSAAAVIRNAGDLTTKGFELSGQYRPIPDLTLSAGAAYIDAKFGDFAGVTCYAGQPVPPCGPPPLTPTSATRIFNAAGLSLPGTPKWTYSFSGAYERPDLVAGLTGSVSATWNWQDDVNYQTNGDPGALQKAFGVLGGDVGIGPSDRRWKVSVYARNILDKRWVSAIGPSPIQAANPRGYYQWFSPDSFRRVGVQLDARF